jgi:energy-coupling factor transport system ATP-binding protein
MGLSVIEIEGLHYAYPPALPDGGPTQVLRGVELAVERGEFLALMGATGAGKTTLCLALNGLVPRATSGLIRGRVRVLGRDARQVPTASWQPMWGCLSRPEASFSAPPSRRDRLWPRQPGAGSPRDATRGLALERSGVSDHRRARRRSFRAGKSSRVAIAASWRCCPRC